MGVAVENHGNSISWLHLIRSIENGPEVVEKGKPWELIYLKDFCFINNTVKIYKIRVLGGQDHEPD